MRTLALTAVCLLSLFAVAWGQAYPPATSPAVDYPPELAPQPYPFPHEPGMPPPVPPTPPAYGPPAYAPWSAPEWHYHNPLPPPPSQAELIPPPAPTAKPTRFDHLMQAAQHLEAAGLKEQAAEVRRKAKREELRPLLAEKLEQLETLKAEVQRLREAAGPEQQVALDVQLIELPSGKLPRLAKAMAAQGLVRFPHRTAQSVEKRAFTVGLMSAKADREALTELLQAEKDLQVIACPKLVTTSGRPATFCSGGEFPIVVPDDDGAETIEIKKYGTQLEFVPHVLANGHLRLEVRPRVSKIDHTRSTKIGDHVIPGLCVRECELGIEIRSGETLVLCCPATSVTAQGVQQTSGEAADEAARDLLVLVTPKLIDANDDQAATAPVVEQPAKPCARSPR